MLCNGSTRINTFQYNIVSNIFSANATKASAHMELRYKSFLFSLYAPRVLFHVRTLIIESTNGSAVAVDVSLKGNRERNSQFVA